MRALPASSINLFQLIYVLIREYSERTGKTPLNLSLGNPDGVPPEAIRRLKARFAEDPGYDYHTYAEDKNLHGFAEAMVELHSGLVAAEHPHLKTLPIAGIKTAGALMPLACGLHRPRGRRRTFTVASNVPAYDIIGTWSEGYLGGRRVTWPLRSEDGMRLSVERLKTALGKRRPDLVYVIRPGNPASVGATRPDWESLIRFCLSRRARLVNDAAYAGLASDGSHVPLAAVAKDHPRLEWIEMYSVSKSFNDPGARLGALVGSRDFVEDFILVKGNTDSGPVPSVMAAYGEFLRDKRASAEALARLRGLYGSRLDYVILRLKAAGLRPACEAEAGFFTLWKVPRRALGKALPRGAGAAEAFNRLVIRETGIVGVHFGGSEPLIRYAVCADVLDRGFQERFEEALGRLKPEY